MASKEVKELQGEVRRRFLQNPSPLTLHYSKGHSNTTRSKAYKKDCNRLDCGALDRVIQIDAQKRLAIVEPRLTMEKLVEATVPFGLMAPVIPEFKGITVGGAIMGGAAESASHRFGIFNDACIAFEIILGDGTLLRASRLEHPDVFYGIAGSYGSLGILVSAEIQLIPVKEFVRLRYHSFSDPHQALQMMREMSQGPDFLDGMIFSKNAAVVVEGTFHDAPSTDLSRFSLRSASSPWYYQHAKQAPSEEIMPLSDYVFRYDQGAFWMGAFMFKLPLLARLIGQGIFKLFKPPQEGFNSREIQQFRQAASPSFLQRTLFHPCMDSQSLWNIQHRAEKWVHDRFMIQDFCIPETKAALFLEAVLEDPGIFPIWLCPIKGTQTPQLFSPHLFSGKTAESHFINFGLYGIPAYSAPMAEITRKLEKKTAAYGGRKVLYSRSYYTKEEFWKIYSEEAYRSLRQKTCSEGIWQEITDKVLSE